MRRILLYILTVSLTISGMSQSNNTVDNTENTNNKKSKLPIFLQEPSQQERNKFFKKLETNNLSDDEFAIIGKKEVGGITYISAYSNLKFGMALVAAAKHISEDKKKIDRLVLLYYNRTKVPTSEQLKVEENRLNDGLMGLIGQTSKGKLFIRMYYPRIGFVDSEK